MNLDALGRKLTSQKPTERLEVARFLAANAGPEHAEHIERALGMETVAWVRSALKRAMLRANPEELPALNLQPPELSEFDTAQIYSNALETTAAQIIHEIEPILGAMRLSAEIDVPNFSTSDTKRELDRMEELVAGLSRLRRAASAPKIEEFSLSDCISDWIKEEEEKGPVSILRAGPKGCNVDGDRSLVSLCFINGLRNAIDATLALQNEPYPTITVSWGSTDVDYWVAIIDLGVGFRGNLPRAFEIGSTTKAGHLGMGLATAQQAMTSMEGSVQLIPVEDGVRFEMRWPKAG